LYNPQDLQCRTCARRFPNTDDGQAKRDAHLDWHFRINKRIRENVGRGQTRSWYLTEEVRTRSISLTNVLGMDKTS